jgi:hypothetical protein|tara:strand:- start:1108 stop:2118 length:1011 start_codon:yes stop_codon:yes gene_type:complete
MGFKRLDAEDFVVSADAVQSTAWSTGTPTLTTFYTSSNQAGSTSANFYISVFQETPTADAAEVQFDIAYGNVLGSGSIAYDTQYPRLSPSSTIYGQYRSMVLEDENSRFSYGDGTNINEPVDFWVLSIDRARYKEKMYPGTFNLKLEVGGQSVELTDNSNDVLTQTFIGSTRVFQIVSGSNGSAANGNGYYTNSGSYGLFLPEMGTILLNPDALSAEIGLSPVRGSATDVDTNYSSMFNAISTGASFTLNAEETITSDYVFIRARNSEFNYSTNPSFISGSTGEVIYDTFINNPQVYATTVGMYNDANELVAVAKLSRPLLKDFTKESLIRVKLDF